MFTNLSDNDYQNIFNQFIFFRKQIYKKKIKVIILKNK